MTDNIDIFNYYPLSRFSWVDNHLLYLFANEKSYYDVVFHDAKVTNV